MLKECEGNIVCDKCKCGWLRRKTRPSCYFLFVLFFFFNFHSPIWALTACFHIYVCIVTWHSLFIVYPYSLCKLFIYCIWQFQYLCKGYWRWITWCILKALTIIEASDAIASLNIPSFFFLINDFQRYIVYPVLILFQQSSQTTQKSMNHSLKLKPKVTVMQNRKLVVTGED